MVVHKNLRPKKANLGYADFKLDFACMHMAGCAHLLSLCVGYDHYAFKARQSMANTSNRHNNW